MNKKLLVCAHLLKKIRRNFKIQYINVSLSYTGFQMVIHYFLSFSKEPVHCSFFVTTLGRSLQMSYPYPGGNVLSTLFQTAHWLPSFKSDPRVASLINFRSSFIILLRAFSILWSVWVVLICLNLSRCLAVRSNTSELSEM